jgi:hypothetical protein
MEKNFKKRIKICFEKPQEGISFERLFKALSLILSEDDIIKYLSDLGIENVLASPLNNLKKSQILTKKGH